MDSSISQKAIFTVICVVLWTIANGIQLSIEPNTVKQLRPQDVEISCQPIAMKNMPLQILLLQIFKHGQEKAVASVYNNIPTGRSNNQTTDVKVKGHIDVFFELSYLNVTLVNFVASTSDKYECLVNYLDYNGELKNETESVEINVEKPSLDTLGSVVGDLVKKVEELEKGKSNLEKQATDNQERVGLLEEVIKNQKQESQDEINELKKEIQTSDDKVVDLQHELEDQRNLTKISEDNVIVLQKLIKAKIDSTDKQVAGLKDVVTQQENATNIDEKKYEDLLSWVQKLEKINSDQDVKIMTLNLKEKDVETELKDAQIQIVNNAATYVSKTELRNSTNELRNLVKTNDDQMEIELKSLENQESSDKNKLLNQLTNFATNAQLISLANKEANDVLDLKQKDDTIVAQTKIVKSKIDNQIKDIQQAETINAKLLTDLKNDLTAKSKSIGGRLTTVEKSKQDFENKIQTLTVEKDKLWSELSDEIKSEQKEHNDIRQYVDSSILKHHPPKPDCSGMSSGWMRKNCLNKG